MLVRLCTVKLDRPALGVPNNVTDDALAPDGIEFIDFRIVKHRDTVVYVAIAVSAHQIRLKGLPQAARQTPTVES